MPALTPISSRRSFALTCLVAGVLLLPANLEASVPFSGNMLIRSGLDGARTVLAADLDGDDVPDVVGIGDEVVYALNGGDGSTWTPVDLASNPSRARQLAVADLDGDDDLDVLYTDYDEDRVYRYFNNLDTSGSFSGRAAVATIFWADGIVAGDLDGDGDIDLAATSRQGATYYWIENTDGAGTSWATHVIASGLDGAQQVAIGDIDEDGDLDLVGGGSEDEPKLVWFENAAGDASEWSTHEIDDSWVKGIEIADIDLDGDPDIIVSENDAGLPAAVSDQVVWWQNVDGDGDVWFENVIGSPGSDATDGVQIVDLDFDGDLDVVSSRGGDYFENTDGNATSWTRHSYSDFDDIDDHDVADFDRDGDLDIVGARLERDRLDWWQNLTCSPSDLDSDGDDASDACDVCDGFDDFEDADGDTVPDGCDLCSGGDDRVDVDSNGTPDDCQATGTLAIDDVSMAEGDSGTTDFIFTVTLTGGVAEAFTVDYATRDESATTADSDYGAAGGTLAFVGNDGETQTFAVEVAGDTTVEDDETFSVVLAAPSSAGVSVADDTGVGTIENDDAASLAIGDVSQVEGDSGNTDFVFTVTLTGEVQGGFTVPAQTQDGTATAGSDYSAASSTLAFAGTGGEMQTFTVGVTGDTVTEPDETFSAVLGTPSVAAVAVSDGTGQATILDDDARGTLNVDFTGTGFATVMSQPAGVDCEPSGGPACSASFATGLDIELGVETDIDTKFDGFSGDADCADGRVSFAVDGESVSCTAHLSPSQPIFVDGFESGDISAWSLAVGAN